MSLRALRALGPGLLFLGACAAPPDEAAGASSTLAFSSSNVVVRAFQPATGEHFYTTSLEEAVHAGFAVESAAYFFVAAVPGDHAAYPLFRCFIPGVGKHFYTQS